MTCSFFLVAFLPNPPPKKIHQVSPRLPFAGAKPFRFFHPLVEPLPPSFAPKVKERLVNPWREQCLGFVGVPLYSDSTLLGEFGRFWRTDPMGPEDDEDDSMTGP